MIDGNFEYFEVPFSCGDVINAPGQNVGSSKIFSFGLMTAMSEEETLKLFGEIYANLDPNGTDHQNIRNFKKFGWSKVAFDTGLSIISKLQAYEDTDSAMATQSVNVGESEWDTDSDSWMP